MKNRSDSVGQRPRREDPQIPVDGATNQLVAKFSRLYAEADPEDQFAVRVWMRDMILGRKEGRVNMLHGRRIEKRMVEACERRILEFPVGMDAREVAKELKRGLVCLGDRLPKYHSSDRTRAGKSWKLSNASGYKLEYYANSRLPEWENWARREISRREGKDEETPNNPEGHRTGFH